MQFCLRQHHIQLCQISKRYCREFLIWPKDSIKLVCNNKTIESSKSVKLLEFTIDNKLNFGIHINDIYKLVSNKIKGLGRIKNRLNSAQAKNFCNSFILSQFNYCCFVWIICRKTLKNKINQIRKRVLRRVYNKLSFTLKT